MYLEVVQGVGSTHTGGFAIDALSPNAVAVVNDFRIYFNSPLLTGSRNKIEVK